MKRIVLCSAESVYTDAVLQQLSADPKVKIVGLVSSTRVLKKGENTLASKARLLQRVGVGYGMYLLRITTAVGPLGRVFQTMRRWAWHLECVIVETGDVNSAEMVDWLNAREADVIVCAHFNQIISSNTIEAVKAEFLNIHPGHLPNYRGLDPMFFALLRGETEVGVTFHRIDAGIDTGDVLGQASMEVQERSLTDCNMEAFRRGSALLCDYLAGRPTERRDMAGSESYDSWPTPADVRMFISKGNRF
ncbi:MAG: formyltransferase family protein [Pseudomonadota bacterium]